jgi:hypothetical protein
VIRTLENHSEPTKDFLNHIRGILHDYRVRLIFTTGKRVRHQDGDLCAGFFREPLSNRYGEIRIATGGKRISTVLAVLAHEYAHFLQWKNQERIYTDDQVDYVMLEKRTEAKAIELLKEWQVPLNYRAVKQRSQAYLTYLMKNSITG